MLSLWGCGELGRVIHKSTGWRRRAGLGGARDIDRLSVAVEPRQAAWPVEDGKLAVGVLVHPHGGLDVMMAMALRRDLQRDAVPVDAIVAADLAALLDAQDVRERPAGIGQESRAFLGRWHRKAGVVVGHELLSQIAVGGRDRGDLWGRSGRSTGSRRRSSRRSTMPSATCTCGP